MEQIIKTEAQMEALGARIAVTCATIGGCVYLNGELGAGKTTLVRGLLRRLGHQGPVKSPTFTLVEPYELNNKCIYHFDLYRVTDVNELELIGLRDYFVPGNLCLVEWPERGEGLLPTADLRIDIRYAEAGRWVRCDALTAPGKLMLTILKDQKSM